MEAVVMGALFPDKIEVYKRLGEVHEKLGHYGFAMDAYFAGLERKPDDHQLIYYLARSYEKLYSNTGKEDYKERAKDLWIQLIEIGKYKSEAKKYLRR